MAYDRTQGDPKIKIDVDGADLVFRGGQPVMDSGLENAVLISLFSEAVWFGNAFASPSSRIESRFYTLSLKSITASRLAELERAVKADLKSLVSQGVIAEPVVRASNPSGDRIVVQITVSPPGAKVETILLSRYGGNWAVQTTNPASAKVQ
jgi:phage gp46-like protein